MSLEDRSFRMRFQEYKKLYFKFTTSENWLLRGYSYKILGFDDNRGKFVP